MLLEVLCFCSSGGSLVLAHCSYQPVGDGGFYENIVDLALWQRYHKLNCNSWGIGVSLGGGFEHRTLFSGTSKIRTIRPAQRVIRDNRLGFGVEKSR